MTEEGLLEAVRDGNASLEDVKAWVKENQAAFERPNLKNFAGLRENEADRLIDAYSDWEIRAHSLGRAASRASKWVFESAEEAPASSVMLARALRLLSPLLHNPQAEAMGAFQLGYALWKSGRLFDASEALAEAIQGFSQTKTDPLLELSALSYLSNCLLEDKRFDDTLKTSEQLRERATTQHCDGFALLAFFDRGKAFKSLGKAEDALASLKAALDGRRSLPDTVAREQSVPSLDSFLDAYGQAARQFGRYEEALETFQELAELQSSMGQVALQAHAISDIGYTYHQAGEIQRAIDYLNQAANIATTVGDTINAGRWRGQAELMSGKESVTVETSSTPSSTSALDSPHDVYALNLHVQQLVTIGKYGEAIALGRRVLEWAEARRDTHLEISVRNMLGVSFMSTDDRKEAVHEFHKGIQLADGTGETSASLTLRYNLAKAYLQARDYKASHDVLLMGIGFCQQLLSKSDASEFRQEIIAGSLGLYELLVLLLSHAEHHGNHMEILAMTETVRCQNLLRWLAADYSLESAAAPEDVVTAIRAEIQAMRAVEIELEVRHLARKITAPEIARLREKRVEAEARVRALSSQFRLPDQICRQREGFQPYVEVEEALEDVVEPGSACVCLFCVPEGISPVVVSRDGERIRTTGRHVRWDWDTRREAFTHWTGNAAFRQGLGRLQLVEGTSGAHRSIEEVLSRFDGFLDEVAKNLMDAIVALVEPIGPTRLTIVPHAELALIPYWQLADRCRSVSSITVAPSLSALRMCVARKRTSRGTTVIVPDLSNTLAHARKEIGFVKQTRADGQIIESRTVDQLHRVADGCSVLHVAAHGLFNVDNPYHSGFLAGQGESVEGLFVQYVDLHSHQLSDKPRGGAIRLMTVAECMTELSLRHCRLAVVSTCESGIPRQHGGGELTGLPNALLVAGAKSVIASLWEVNDAATAMLMRYFYETWDGGSGPETSPARALALARQRLRVASRAEIERTLGYGVALPTGVAPFDHPMFCDAFQCFGSW